MTTAASEASAIILMVLATLGILGWGFYRAKPFGKLGILAWLQSVVLMSPWLLFFGLFAAGIYLNLVGILFLIVASTGLYVLLGKQLRAAGQDTVLRERAAAMLKARQEANAGPISHEGHEPGQPGAESTLTLPETEVPETALPIPAEDLKAIQGIFGIDTFFATETIPYQEGAIFKGNLRGNVDEAYTRLTDSLQERLGDRYRLFLVENQEGKPVVIVLPSRNDPKPTTLPQKLLALSLAIATVATCLETGGILLGFDFFSAPQRFREVLPIGSGILAVLAAHEIGHRVLARRHQVRLSP
ncbi:MAG TPA: hypothetical protein V6D16_05590, partial [Candidatus Obscuribacterales bacterium]